MKVKKSRRITHLLKINKGTGCSHPSKWSVLANDGEEEAEGEVQEQGRWMNDKWTEIRPCLWQRPQKGEGVSDRKEKSKLWNKNSSIQSLPQLPYWWCASLTLHELNIWRSNHSATDMSHNRDKNKHWCAWCCSLHRLCSIKWIGTRRDVLHYACVYLRLCVNVAAMKKV